MICLAALLADELNDRLYLVFGETRNLVIYNKNGDM